MTPEHGHDPVLLSPVLKLLEPRPGDVVLDCTVGRGGHALALAQRVGPSGTLLAMDVDPQNLTYARDRLQAALGPQAPSFMRFFLANFDEALDVVAKAQVDRVDVLADAKVNVVRNRGSYVVEAAVPLATLGFNPESGKSYKLDMGVIFSDAKGDNRAARVYWANKATGLVNDVPGEIMASPEMWGTATVK